MRTTTGHHLVVVIALAAGWSVGFAAQRSIVEETGYLDVSPGLLVLGLILCTLAGAAAFVLLPARRRVQTGALAGVAMVASIVAGYLLLVFLYRDRFPAGDGGETWFSLLLESWFWIGVPLVVSATVGALGWLTAAWVDRRTTPRPGTRGHATPV